MVSWLTMVKLVLGEMKQHSRVGSSGNVHNFILHVQMYVDTDLVCLILSEWRLVSFPGFLAPNAINPGNEVK